MFSGLRPPQATWNRGQWIPGLIFSRACHGDLDRGWMRSGFMLNQVRISRSQPLAAAWPEQIEPGFVRAQPYVYVGHRRGDALSPETALPQHRDARAATRQ